MNKLSKEKRDHLILVGFGGLVVLVGLWFGLIQSQIKSINQSHELDKKLLDQISKAETTLKKAPAMEKEYEASAAHLKAIEDGMGNGDMYAWSITTINRFIVPYRVSIRGIGQPALGEVGTFLQFPYKAATFNLSGSAYYHDFGKFLADFENSFPFFRVQNLDITPAVAGEDREKLDFKFDVVTLVKPTAQ